MNDSLSNHRRLSTYLSLARPVWFEFHDRQAREVALIGKFGAWHDIPLPMAPNGHGTWIRVLFLCPGRYEYHYLVDGHPAADSAAKETAPCTNGNVHSLLVVKPLKRGSALLKPSGRTKEAAAELALS